MTKIKYAVLALLVIAVPVTSYYLGQRSTKKVVWLSELVERTQGKKVFLIDLKIVCSNGKELGPLQVDLNLTNGQLRIVRNDAGREPSCVK